MSHRAVFLDRDGTIARDVPYCSDPRDFELLPRVPAAIRRLNESGFKVVVITNQSGIARGYFTLATLALIHDKMTADLAAHEAFVDAIYHCPHHPDDGCECRKPRPALLIRAAREMDLALDRSYMIGDDVKDVQAGQAAGCRTVRLTSAPAPLDQRPAGGGHHVAADLYEAVEWLLKDA